MEIILQREITPTCCFNINLLNHQKVCLMSGGQMFAFTKVQRSRLVHRRLKTCDQLLLGGSIFRDSKQRRKMNSWFTTSVVCRLYLSQSPLLSGPSPYRCRMFGIPDISASTSQKTFLSLSVCNHTSVSVHPQTLTHVYSCPSPSSSHSASVRFHIFAEAE